MAEEEKSVAREPAAGADDLSRPVGTGATAGDHGCPERMDDGQPCGRPIYTAPPGVDKEPVCLMHSRDQGKSDEEFQEEFERILNEAGDGIADFTRFVFPSCNYSGRTFKARCIFWHATFTQAADFGGATFTQDADFHWATFTREANFGRATFEQAADFGYATFTQAAYFRVATFTGHAHFVWATFSEAAEFGHATFTQDAVFIGATFTEAADFRLAVFKQGAQFRETKFREDERPKPGPIFGEAMFEKPEAVVFYKTYLGQALFHNCDVSKLTFSDVRWRRRKNGKWKVLEEEPGLDLRIPWALDLRPPEKSADERNYTLIAELYQQLKKNYDAKCDYRTAGDFHYGEMEMKRLSSPRRNKLLRWLHRNLGLVAWYKYASEYGENYVLPALWLLVVLLAFAMIYPLAGLDPVRSVGQATALHSERRTSQVGLVEAYSGPNVMTTVGVAFFQRDLEYRPAYPWGRALSWLQLLLTYTLVALFLLALRRQFRR